jgi:hypothetical protein
MSELAVGSLKGLAANAFKIEVASGSQIVQPGAILQVVQTVLPGQFSTTSTSFTDITGLSAVITPTSDTSKILVSVSLVAGYNDVGNARFNIVRNSTTIAQPSSGTLLSTFITRAENAFTMTPASFTFLDSPATTSATTYKMQTIAESAKTVFVNRRGNDTNFTQVSTITLMEVAG